METTDFVVRSGSKTLREAFSSSVQTFLPYPDFAASAAVLDSRRLGKQRVETLQILRALTRETYGWKHHPAVKMWRGFEPALVAYGLAICHEWTERGGADTCAVQIAEEGPPPDAQNVPTWVGDEDFHRSHRSALLRKDPEFYSQYFDEPDDLPYVWPAPA